MPTTIAQLKREAIKAHAAGETWQTFHGRVGEQIRAIEPYNRRRYHKLALDLHMLLLCGKGKPGGGDWWQDDAEQQAKGRPSTLG